MPSRSLFSLVLSLALIIGCQHSVRTRFALPSAAPGVTRTGAGSCRQQCEKRRDPTACFRTCPGAIVEPGRSCKTRIPGQREVCFESTQFDDDGTLSATIMIGVFGAVVGAAVIAVSGDFEHGD